MSVVKTAANIRKNITLGQKKRLPKNWTIFLVTRNLYFDKLSNKLVTKLPLHHFSRYYSFFRLYADEIDSR